MTAPRTPAPPPGVRVPKRRGVELSLLVCAVLIAVYGYAAVGLARGGA
ncbi:FtsW/RodA/SpoVE family cell cycle protein, partial [Streptomyces sp. WAC08241]